MRANNKQIFYNLLGAAIMEARKELGLSQEALAELVNMSRASIVNIEKGRQFPPLHLVWQIAESLNTNVNSLIPKKDFTNNELNPLLKKELLGKRSKLNSDSYNLVESWLTKELG